MGLFGFGKKKEDIPGIMHFIDQRLDATPAWKIYLTVNGLFYNQTWKNYDWNPGNKYGCPITYNYKIEADSFLKRLRIMYTGLNEAGMDPIPKRQKKSYYEITEWDLMHAAAERGSAEAAIWCYFYRMSDEKSRTEHEKLLKFGTGELGEKYADIIEHFKTCMLGTEADTSQNESFIITVNHTLRKKLPDNLPQKSLELREYVQARLTEFELNTFCTAAKFAEYCMAVSDNYPSSRLRMCTVLSTKDKDFFNEQYEMHLNTDEDMVGLANKVAEGVVLRARSGDEACMKACRLWGIS